MKLEKPIKTDASFLYICPNDNCRIEHWVYLREAQTKNFKVVCYCGTVFKVKQIQNIHINYLTIDNNVQKIPENIICDKPQVVVPLDIEEKCVKILTEYGFTEIESKDILNKAYQKCATDSPIELIKLSLQLLEINNV